MKRGTHEIGVSLASSCDVAVHGAGNGVVFEQVSVCGRLVDRPLKRVLNRCAVFAQRAGALRAMAGPGFEFVPEGEDGVLLFMFAAMDGKAFGRFPAADGPFAPVQISSDLFPGFERLLRSIALRHDKTLAQDYSRTHKSTRGCRLSAHACQ